MYPDPNTGQGNAVPPQPDAGVNNPVPTQGEPTNAAILQDQQSVPPLASPPAAAASWLPPSVPVQPSASGENSPALSSSGSVAVNVPDTADDGDLIEKEWVMKAKHIVEQTKRDPHQQTKEMHKFKAEYMKKRYNKIIEPVEE